MNNFALALMMLMISIGLNAQPQAGDCVSDNETFRNDRNDRVSKDENPPFNDDDLEDFESLYYYPVDCNFIFEAKFEPITEQKVDVDITGGGTIQLYKVGTVDVTVDGTDKTLVVYKNKGIMSEFDKGALFIPIKDKTSKGTTYENGRYVVLDPGLTEGIFQLDFNKAINPYQNYNKADKKLYSIITPNTNIMAAPLTVGERKYEDRTR